MDRCLQFLYLFSLPGLGEQRPAFLFGVQQCFDFDLCGVAQPTARGVALPGKVLHFGRGPSATVHLRCNDCHEGRYSRLQGISNAGFRLRKRNHLSSQMRISHKQVNAQRPNTTIKLIMTDYVSSSKVCTQTFFSFFQRP